MTPPRFGPQLEAFPEFVGGVRVTSAALLTRDEIVRGCMNAGWSRDRAEAAASLEMARRGAIELVASGNPVPLARAIAQADLAVLERALSDVTYTPSPDPAVITWPLTLVLPWSALVSDDRKYSPSKRRQPDGGEHGIMILRPEYRQAKAKARAIAKDALPLGAAPVELPLSMTVRVFVPDNRRHDVVNFAKCVQDAFTGVVYVDDCWLYANQWLRAGVDVDRPRAEITINPISP